MLIGKINDKNGQKLLVTIRDVRGTKKIDFRLHHMMEDGELIRTPAGVSLTLGQLDEAIPLLQAAKRAITKES